MPVVESVSIPTAELLKNYSVIQYSGLRKDIVAPFEIITPDNGLYYILILRDKETNRNEIGLFIYPGCTHEFLVPLGEYNVLEGCGVN